MLYAASNRSGASIPLSKTRSHIYPTSPTQTPQKLLHGLNMKFQPKTSDAQQAWKRIMSVKTTVIEAIVRNGYNVFIMDADTALLANPTEHLQGRAPHCDFQWQADGKDKFKFGMGFASCLVWKNWLRFVFVSVQGLCMV